MKLLFLFLIAIVHTTMAGNTRVIHQLSKAEYYRLPMKYHLDRYAPCVGKPGGVYCTTYADIVTDKPSELKDLIDGYSAAYLHHYNYSNIRYGLCITQRCAHLYNGDNSHDALWNTTEACLNETMTREYDLKARVTSLECNHGGESYSIDSYDVLMLAILGLLVALNVIGTLYDLFRDQSTPGYKMLMAFSLRANWKNLTGPPIKDPNHNLQCLNGMRALSSMIVVWGHIQMLTINTASNPEAYEGVYDPLLTYLVHQGHLVTVMFFTICGFLLAYSLQNKAEKAPLKWTEVTSNTFQRWLRLTPANFVVLIITAVSFKFFPRGPLFGEFVASEGYACRKNWLYNMLYVNNLMNDNYCNIQVWFLASEFQLHIIGLLVLVLAPSKRARNLALVTLYLIGISYPAYQVYANNWDGTFMATLTTTNGYFITSPTFNYLFKRTIPNLPGFIIGIYFGCFIYNLQKKGLLKREYTEYRWAYYFLIVPLFFVLVAQVIFYLETPMPVFVKVLYNPIIRPMWAIIMNLYILGAACKCEDLLRGILEWEGWTIFMRLSYCLFLVHTNVIRYSAGTTYTLNHFSYYHVVQDYLGVLGWSYMCAILLHLMVELPMSEVTNRFYRFISGPKKTKRLNQVHDETSANKSKQALDESSEAKDEIKND